MVPAVRLGNICFVLRPWTPLKKNFKVSPSAHTVQKTHQFLINSLVLPIIFENLFWSEQTHLIYF